MLKNTPVNSIRMKEAITVFHVQVVLLGRIAAGELLCTNGMGSYLSGKISDDPFRFQAPYWRYLVSKPNLAVLVLSRPNDCIGLSLTCLKLDSSISSGQSQAAAVILRSPTSVTTAVIKVSIKL